MLRDPAFTPIAVMLLFAAGIVLAMRSHDRLFVGLSLLAVAASLPGLVHSTAGLQMASARYQLQSIIPLVSVAAYGLVIGSEKLGARWSHRASGWATAIAWGMIIVSSLPPLVRVNRPVTIDREFAFLRRTLPLLPRDAVVYVSHPDGRIMDVAGFRSMAGVADWVGRKDLRWRLWDEAAQAGDGPAFFYRQPACELPEHRLGDAPPGTPDYECLPCVVERCREGMSRSLPVPVAEVTVPARPFGPENFADPQVTIGLYPLAPPNP